MQTAEEMFNPVGDLSPEEESIFRGELVDNLFRGKVTVTFKKVNGEIRVMECSLNSNYTPKELSRDDYGDLMEKNTLAVWDIKADNWRSFRYDSIMGIEIHEEA